MILLLGSTGTVGRHAITFLKRAGARVTVGGRSPEKARQLEVDHRQFDWTRPETYAPTLSGARTVFLLTPVDERQVQWSHDLLAVAKAEGVRRIVKLSVAGADQEPGIALTRLHRATERELEASGLAWTFLRPNFYMQNFTSYYGVVPGRAGTVFLPNGTGKVSWADASDLGEVAARVLSEDAHDGKVYTLTGEEAFDTGTACSLLSEASGHEIQYVDVPEAAARQGMAAQGLPPSLVEAMLELHTTIRNGWAAGVSPDMARLLGRPPRSFATFARAVASRAG